MAVISWDSVDKMYYAGVDHGVVYLPGRPGVPWNGLTTVTEENEASIDTSRYIDGVRYALPQAPDEFGLKIMAYTYPDEIMEATGEDDEFDSQSIVPFGLSYRVGDEKTGQIHIVYNATAKQSDKSWQTLSDSPDATMFSWDVSTRPAKYALFAPTAHIVIEMNEIYPSVLADLKEALYGTSSTNPYLPTIAQLYEIFALTSPFQIVDNGDGTWTATGPDEYIQMLDVDTFQITSPSLIYYDSKSYKVSNY